jgi:3-hydroxymyristoyl/3-hydroxydecanoyl-(acyl carrier protein) dehydratase/1-acyl-sn-glycerol-3-phosphate acyltransferase
VRAHPIAYDVAVHVPELSVIQAEWRALHHRRTAKVPGVRFYTAGGAPYSANADSAADGITAQAVGTLDFPAVVERAYADGVRVFVEHGPKALVSGWIGKILGDRPHLAVALDRGGRTPIRGLLNTLAALVAAGLPIDADAVISRLPTPKIPRKGNVLVVPAHPKEVHLTVPDVAMPAKNADVQVMARAPSLPPIGDEPVTSTQAPAGRNPASFAPPARNLQAPAREAVPIAKAESVASPSEFRAEDAKLAEVGPAPTALFASRVVDDTAIADVAATHAAVAAAHQAFMDQQAHVHAAFLAMRARTAQGLLDAYAHAGAGSPEAVAAPALQAIAPAPRPVSPPAPKPAPPAPALQPVASSDPSSQKELPGPKYSRQQLEVLASGRISEVFGPEFADQDGFHRQVRMPEPPLLLADRVTGIDAVAHSMKKGTIWTETDVRPDSWYLNEGRMPAGVHIESGQADLLLISWLGIDRSNRSDRVYRLLGCDLTWHDSGNGVLPAIGDTLKYDIHVDGHANQGPIRLFFFHYDCKIDGKPRLTVRNGQAGFFTDQELAESGGILWDAETGEHATTGPLDPPRAKADKSRFTRADLDAFAAGRTWECFGPEFWPTKAHVRTPRIQSGRMLFLDEVSTFDPAGGPWKRGYLRAEQPIHANDWFFDGHFKNDPCMPGTLMFEGCVQAMAFYLAAMGFTLDADGWRFEPVPDQAYALRCRGQVIPSSKHLVYEVFVEEVVSGPVPTLYADLLCTVDGLKAFHARRVGLRLVPGWPLDAWKHEPVSEAARVHGGDGATNLKAQAGLRGWVEPKPVAVTPDGFAFDYHSLLACGWGRPSDAFGKMYARFDGTRRVARLPGPPYHFMTRVTKADAPIGVTKPGGTIEVEYDIPPEVWYFDENGYPTMPFCVLMEAALQPCGWLASYVGSALGVDVDLLFRNLDGTGNLVADILPGGVLRTVAKITNISQSGGMIIESFAVEQFIGNQKVFTMTTVFGFFPKEAFENQAGLPITPEEKARMGAPSDYLVDLTTRPAKYCGGTARLANPMLLMIDRVTAFDPTGGKAQKGWMRGEKDVDPGEWFFKAHFFQDPVQPGSLGVEALLQLLQFWMLENGLDAGIPGARFEPVALGNACTWKYRGQVTPKNKVIGSEIEITKVEDAGGVRTVTALASLWVDGKRIYQVKDLGMRIVPSNATKPVVAPPKEEVLDAAVDTWLADHCPTWTMPALPLLSMVDRLAGAVDGTPVALRDVQVHRWLPFAGGPVRLQTVRGTPGPGGTPVTLSAWRAAKTEAMSRFEPVASGIVRTGDAYEAAPTAPAAIDGPLEPDPYASGALFHGPAFHHLVELRYGKQGSSAIVDAAPRGVPYGALHQGLLDAITHAIPHDSLDRWSPEIAADLVAYPYRIPTMTLYGKIPDQGRLRVEVRFAGFDDAAKRLPRFDAWLAQLDGTVLVALRLVEILLPKGPIGMAPRPARIAFLRDRQFAAGVALSHPDGDGTVVDAATVKQSDWLPGNVARIYAIPEGADPVATVGVKDHVGQRVHAHPSRVGIVRDGAIDAARPLRRHPVAIARNGDAVRVTSSASRFDLSPVKDHWDARFELGRWPVEDLYYGLIERFVHDIVFTDADAFAASAGRSCLYLGNHQVGVESLLFAIIVSALSRVSTVTLAKAEHRTSWLGTLIKHSFSYPGVTDPNVITFFDREDRASLMRIIGELATEMVTVGKSAMVHVEGTRSVSCRKPVMKMSSAFVDMALTVNAPIVPIRFVGGLPVDDLETRLEFPLGMGQQDFWIGRPILPEQLQQLPLKERKQYVIDAMNALGPPHAEEEPLPGDPAFAAAVDAWIARTGASPEDAVLYAVLAEAASPSEPVRRLLAAATTGVLRVGRDPADAWLAVLAERLFGPRGPRIEHA